MFELSLKMISPMVKMNGIVALYSFGKHSCYCEQKIIILIRWMHIACVKTYKQLFVSNYLALAELIITAGGENIPPVPIEDSIKEEVSIISNVMLVGDKKKFLSMILTLKVSVCLLSETIKCAHFTKCLHLYQLLYEKKTLLRHHFQNVCCYIFFLNDWILFLV